ncbi:malto-oligosyltrehalose trehalohydrolase [Plantibacter sp. T3]|uniref:malto-oligosyltrehalose trehalohydrolase n=1 Tax=Plantibacter sp. T3 TaxID=2653161 RepID=UPI0012F2E3F3|nr:malto-oligosyltrehalose trehalohydrolase [Plantibacter sp. T3]VXB03317.1 Malto-oligosyltrehalose trehalohydrolase [Plantibacter sp. T3]
MTTSTTSPADGFRVWAPEAQRVDLVLDGEQHPMDRDVAEGWWIALDGAEPRAAVVDSDYRYLVDGEGPFADPRSRRQPEGVHGPSRVVASDPVPCDGTGWRGRSLIGAVLYELHIGTFTEAATFDGAIERLDDLVELGVDAVEVLPVNAFNGVWNWGYDGVFWSAVHEAYGGTDGYRRFVAACHERGLAVIQDVVYNHLGPSGNVLPRFGPYLADGAGNTWGDSLNLDGPDSDEVRRYIIDSALLWFEEYGVDGLRLDAVHALHDTRAIHLLEELDAAVDALSADLDRPFTLIAESDLNDPKLITPRGPGGAGGYGLDAQWSDDFHHALHVALTGEVSGYYADFAPLGALGKVMEEGFFHNGTWSSFRKRHHGRRIDLERTPSWRLVVSDQNHDQIGNRATGDRLAATLDDGQLAIAAAVTLLGPFTPMLFMGEEWAASTPWQFFTSHPEPELGEATAKGRIAEFARMGWNEADVPDPQDPETYRRSVLDWSERSRGRHATLLTWYRRVIELRRTVPAFTDPAFADTTAIVDEATGSFVLRRGSAMLAVNFGTEPVELTQRVGELLDSFGEVVTTEGSLRLGAHSVAILHH